MRLGNFTSSARIGSLLAGCVLLSGCATEPPRDYGLTQELREQDQALGEFRRHADKDWSFTDCASFIIMRELRIRDAFTTDHHFRQAGFEPLLKL